MGVGVVTQTRSNGVHIKTSSNKATVGDLDVITFGDLNKALTGILYSI